MGIFDRLSYNSYSGTGVSDLSAPVLKQMETLPQMLKPWQQEDMKNNAVGGYFKNPVNDIVVSIWNTANSIVNISHISQINANSIITTTNTLRTSINNFYDHTNRLSGLTDPPESDPTLPTYKTAMGIGKMVMYLTFQVDGIQNNAPMLGNFSSLYTKDDLTTYYAGIQNYVTLITNSIVANTVSDGLGGSSTTYSTTLSPSQISDINTNLSNISTFVNNRRTADVNFYYNSKTLVDEYNTMKTFNNMGQAQTDMVTNLIGSDKLLNRINP